MFTCGTIILIALTPHKHTHARRIYVMGIYNRELAEECGSKARRESDEFEIVQCHVIIGVIQN